MSPERPAASVPERDPLGATDEVGALASIREVHVDAADHLVGGVDFLDARLGRHLEDDLVHEGESAARSLPARHVDLGGDHVDLLECLGFADLLEHILVDPASGVQRSIRGDHHAPTVVGDEVDAWCDTGLHRHTAVVLDTVEHLVTVRTPDDDHTTRQVDTVAVHVLDDTGLS